MLGILSYLHDNILSVPTAKSLDHPLVISHLDCLSLVSLSRPFPIPSMYPGTHDALNGQGVSCFLTQSDS